ncbi:MAG: putative peptidase M15 [Prokaryotic dsDNA virus sp.]|jgi:uncharacterized protein YcbK (DUF882 family)|nr:MAG: putative peptidase M15 [Prokaryotic dsDNA virus sp.]|tara:strand:+ start:295 stop:654 length:360 start_codon:yes stop_codon:yes gene_type:complete
MELKWFRLSEFDEPKKKGSGAKMSKDLLLMLDDLRNKFGKPMKITSGYRSESYNKKIGGVKDSSHIKGLAVDIACNNSRDRFMIVKLALEVGFRRIGIAETFVHLDIDTEKSGKLIWTY